MKLTTAVTGPDVTGANEIVTGWAAEGPSVIGKAGLTIENPDPVTVPENTVVVPEPGFDMMIVWF